MEKKERKTNYCYNISNEPANTISQSSSFGSENDSQNLFNIKMKSNRNFIPYIIIRYPMKQCAASHECVEIIRKPHGSPPPSTVPRMYYNTA